MNQKGNAIVYALLIVPAVMTMSLYALKSVEDTYNKQETSRFEHTAIQSITNQLQSIIENEASWLATIQANSVGPSNMDCLLTHNTSCAGRGGFIDLKLDAATTVTAADFLPSIDITNGFTRSGFLCNNYSIVTPDGRCTYRARIRWDPVCAPPCLSVKSPTEPFAKIPAQRITFEFSYSSSTDDIAGALNINSAGFQMDRGDQQSSVQVFCETLPAQLTGGGIHCQLQYAPKHCSVDSRQMVDYVDNDGNAVCKNTNFVGLSAVDWRRCSAGNAMTGITGDTFLCDVF